MSLFALYCECWQDFFDAKREVDEGGATAVSEKGSVYQHPAVGRKNRAIDQIRKIGAEFGMSPSSRAGLTVTKPKTNGGFKGFQDVG
jgi:P27 family predicted phage terminase small subunit